MKTTFFKPVIEALIAASAEFARRNNSHEIYRLPDRSTVPVPRKLDDRGLAQSIVKRVGARLG